MSSIGTRKILSNINWLIFRFSGSRNWHNGSVSGPRNWQNVSVSGPRNWRYGREILYRKFEDRLCTGCNTREESGDEILTCEQFGEYEENEIIPAYSSFYNEKTSDMIYCTKVMIKRMKVRKLNGYWLMKTLDDHVLRQAWAQVWTSYSFMFELAWILHIYLNSLTQWIDTLYLLSGTDKSTYDWRRVQWILSFY